MKIKKVILENFRSFYGKHEISLENFTAFIGKNDQGKSSILEAIDIFINEGRGVVKIEQDDLNVTAKNQNIDSFKIGIVFYDFPAQIIIDAENQTSLKDEYLLNSERDLEVWKTFKNGRIKETSIKCNHPANDDVLKNLLRKKVKELQDIVKEKNLQCDDKRKSALLRKAIRDSYDNINFQEIEIIVDAEDAKQIWDQLVNYLPIYALFHSDRKNQDLDSEVQDPLKISIDQIFKRDDIKSKLNEIAKEVEREINNIAQNTINKFKEVSKQKSQIKPNIPEVASLKWKDVYKNIGFNTDNEVPLNKRGSGFRRLMLLSFFLAEVEKHKNDTKVHTIYAIEEPETSLHPDLQKILLDSLMNLSNNENYQIIITTHSPQYIRILPKETIIYVEKGTVENFNDNVINKIIENLGILPNVGKVIWCVEGRNDMNFLRNINKNIPELKSIIDIEHCINSGLLAFNLMNGANCGDYIDRYITKNTNAIEFHLYDKDKDSKYEEDIEKVNQRIDGSEGILTNKREIENYVPKELIENEFNIKLENISNWDDFDVAKAISEKINMKENNIKNVLCGKLSQQITKESLESINAWEEVEGWFNKVKNMVDRVTKTTN
ncbi:MAG TPA: ATP-binding protein [Bacteroidota bacterium]|mgnify:FL=1|nr:ATP-binding protein [Bacteroidota bacterium]